MVIRDASLNSLVKSEEQQYFFEQIENAIEGETVFSCKSYEYWWRDIYDTLFDRSGYRFYTTIEDGIVRWFKGIPIAMKASA